MGYVLNQDGRHIGIQNGCHFKLYFNLATGAVRNIIVAAKHVF